MPAWLLDFFDYDGAWSILPQERFGASLENGNLLLVSVSIFPGSKNFSFLDRKSEQAELV